jgi:hypothetical protein
MATLSHNDYVTVITEDGRIFASYYDAQLGGIDVGGAWRCDGWHQTGESDAYGRPVIQLTKLA